MAENKPGTVVSITMDSHRKGSRSVGKQTITDTAKRLSVIGYELIGGLPFDLESMTARYQVRFPDGALHAVTTGGICRLLANTNRW